MQRQLHCCPSHWLLSHCQLEDKWLLGSQKCTQMGAACNLPASTPRTQSEPRAPWLGQWPWEQGLPGPPSRLELPKSAGPASPVPQLLPALLCSRAPPRHPTPCPCAPGPARMALLGCAAVPSPAWAALGGETGSQGVIHKERPHRTRSQGWDPALRGLAWVVMGGWAQGSWL